MRDAVWEARLIPVRITEPAEADRPTFDRFLGQLGLARADLPAVVFLHPNGVVVLGRITRAADPQMIVHAIRAIPSLLEDPHTPIPAGRRPGLAPVRPTVSAHADITLANFNMLFLRHAGGRTERERHLPLGPLYLTAALERAGLRVDFRDYQGQLFRGSCAEAPSVTADPISYGPARALGAANESASC